jgi:hypothetical protein
MNLDELKIAWTAYDRKLKLTHQLNERIISSMITERSALRFRQVRKKYIIGFAWMTICLFAGLAVLTTNPFGYTLTIQYFPIAVYNVCISILLVDFFIEYRKLLTVSIDHYTIDAALRKIIAIYERPKKFLGYTLIVFLFTQVFLFPLSFLPKSIERVGLWMALAERIIPISISVLLLFAAYKLGAFKDHSKDKFRKDLDELSELKALSHELSNGE